MLGKEKKRKELERTRPTLDNAKTGSTNNACFLILLLLLLIGGFFRGPSCDAT
jgi:hypothetical protein